AQQNQRSYVSRCAIPKARWRPSPTRSSCSSPAPSPMWRCHRVQIASLGMTLDAGWRQLLTDGFGAFLNRPLDDDADPDAEYGAYYWAGNFLQDVGFASDARWVDPEALAGRVLVEDDNIVMYDVGEAPLCFDAAA